MYLRTVAKDLGMNPDRRFYRQIQILEEELREIEVGKETDEDFKKSIGAIRG